MKEQADKFVQGLAFVLWPYYHEFVHETHLNDGVLNLLYIYYFIATVAAYIKTMLHKCPLKAIRHLNYLSFVCFARDEVRKNIEILHKLGFGKRRRPSWYLISSIIGRSIRDQLEMVYLKFSTFLNKEVLSALVIEFSDHEHIFVYKFCDTV